MTHTDRVIARNAGAYVPAGRTAWQVVLGPWALASIVAPLVALVWVTQGRGRDAAELGVFAIWFFLGFAGISWLFYARPLLHLWLARSGDEAHGVITKLEHHRFARGPKHSVRYQFRTPNGTEHSGLETLPPEAFAVLSVGDALDVWYLHRAPFVNVPARFCEYSRIGVRALNQQDA
jgi:hypothetical protein